MEHFFTLLYYNMYRYNCLSAYGQSKLANVLHANELARRLQVCYSFKDKSCSESS